MRLQLPSARLRDGALLAHVLHTDHFGNMLLDATPQQLDELGGAGRPLTVQHGGRAFGALHAGAFADAQAGALLLYEDAQRMVALAVNQGSAAELLGASRDDELLVRPA